MSDPWLQSVSIHTDGSCWPNPGGPGGWACVIVKADGERIELSGHLPGPCTNNRAELTAAIEALKSLGEFACSVDLYSDSRYLRDGAAIWIRNWQRRAWRGVKNADLWQKIWVLEALHNIRWHWVPAHQNKGTLNDRCDALADKMRNTPKTTLVHEASKSGQELCL